VEAEACYDEMECDVESECIAVQVAHLVQGWEN
jgi:hypothetical protein